MSIQLICNWRHRLIGWKFFYKMPHFNSARKTSFPWRRVLFMLYFLVTSRVAQSPAACDVVIPLFSISDFLSLLVISPDFSLDLAYAYSTF